MLITVIIENYSTPFNLALVQWYDFRYKNNNRLYKYSCSLIKLLDTYNLIPAESIIELVQIIKREERENEYFVNIYIF